MKVMLSYKKSMVSCGVVDDPKDKVSFLWRSET
jgi:hypothetical protein